MTTPAKGVSVLASLTSEVMEKKKHAARQLTPVAGEAKAQGQPPVIAPTFPSDLPGSFMSKEGMRTISGDLRRHAATLVQIADGLDAESGFTTAPSVLVSLPDVIKEKEREADARVAASVAEETDETAQFRANFEAQKKAAQDAVYGTPAIAAAQAAADAGGGPLEVMTDAMEATVWTCPTHGKPGIEKTSPKSGRTFLGCPNCNAFAR